MSKLKEQLSAVNDKGHEQWAIATSHSRAYQKALGLSDNDLNIMEREHAVINLTGGFKVIAKNTCGAPYGGYWIILLQARASIEPDYSTGGGTTYFETVNDVTHKHIIKALEDDNYNVSHNHIWP